jgi:hypothetical protein
MPVQAYGMFVRTDDRKAMVSFSHVVWISLASETELVLHLHSPGPEGTNQVTIKNPKAINAILRLMGVKDDPKETESASD